jgi:hypothetical protein
MDEPQTSLPTTKVARAARFAKTGFNVGTNYIKHYAKKPLVPNRPPRTCTPPTPPSSTAR